MSIGLSTTMSVVDIRVDLPSYSHSFTVSVQGQASVLDIKQKIQLACPGQPAPHGQRLIHRGRLLTDNELVSDLWKVRMVTDTLWNYLVNFIVCLVRSKGGTTRSSSFSMDIRSTADTRSTGVAIYDNTSIIGYISCEHGDTRAFFAFYRRTRPRASNDDLRRPFASKSFSCTFSFDPGSQ